ncbi:MAG: hypothetical protein WDN69_16295 [Aliidongia sp.]
MPIIGCCRALRRSRLVTLIVPGSENPDALLSSMTVKPGAGGAGRGSAGAGARA